MKVQVTSGGFRLYPDNDDDKKAIWRIKEAFCLQTDVEKWEDVWSLNIWMGDDNRAGVYIQS